MSANDPTTIIRISDKATKAGITYVVKLNKRTGMRTQESYDAEVARIIAMANADGGKNVDVQVRS